MTASATDWKHYYFLGITNRRPNELKLTQAQVRGLLSMLNVNAGIATDFTIDPQYLINAKGTTVWLALYALLAVNYPNDLEAARKNETLLFLPQASISGSFNHNHWPAELNKRFSFNLSGQYLFVLPFLLSTSAPLPARMSQSLSAPDGSLEMFGIHVFDENQPQLLLKNCESLVDWYQKEKHQRD
jgi:hypothetical protein